MTHRSNQLDNNSFTAVPFVLTVYINIYSMLANEWLEVNTLRRQMQLLLV